MITYSIWNNKGGTGKTSLTFQSICHYAHKNEDKRILSIDMCPQANISELLLGGFQNGGSEKLLQRQGMTPRCSIGGYFDARMSSAHTVPNFNAKEYITNPCNYNRLVPENIDLICGDPLLELQANAMNTLANLQLPGVNTWLAVIKWLDDFLTQIKEDYDVVLIDTNPSFSMYTQIALAASERVILPVMADDSSRRAIQNAFFLIYGLKLPYKVYEQYTFANKMKEAGHELPKIHLIIKNRLTQYMRTASAFESVIEGIDKDLESLIKSYQKHFTFNKAIDGIVEVNDFNTAGVISFARGTPFFKMNPGKYTLGTQRPQVTQVNLEKAKSYIDKIAQKLS